MKGGRDPFRPKQVAKPVSFDTWKIRVRLNPPYKNCWGKQSSQKLIKPGDNYFVLSILPVCDLSKDRHS